MLMYVTMKLTNADFSILKPLERLMAQLRTTIVHNWKRTSKTGTTIPLVSKRMVLNRYQRPEKRISGRKATLDPISSDKSPPFLPNTNVDRRSHKPKRTSQLTMKKTAPRNGDIVAWLSGKTRKNLRFA